MKLVSSLPLTAAACILLAGCAHRCPPPEESLECYPICCEVRKAYKENAESVEKQWRNFLTMPSELRFKRTGDPNLDVPRLELARLTVQVHREIIEPYIELDRQGLIRGYSEFCADVEFMQERKKCSWEEAERQVIQDWRKLPDGSAKIDKLMRARPVLQNARYSVQIAKACPRLFRAGVSLLATFGTSAYRRSYDRWFGKPLQKTRSRNTAVAISGYMELAANIIKLADTSYPDIRRTRRLLQAINFLWIYQGDKRSQRRAIDAFVAQMEQMSRDADKDAAR